MFDPRIYRAGFLPALVAVVVIMFSLEPAPEPSDQEVAGTTFRGGQAARLARSLATLAPARAPGSPGDAAAADLVRERFSAVPGGEVSLQDSEVSIDGEEGTVRNVILTLPGEREEVILILADRSEPEGQGATTSAAATAALLTLADELGGTRRQRTIVLASTSGGAEGVRELVGALPTPAGVEAAIAIAQPAVGEPRPPFVVPGRAGPESMPAGLIATAEEIASVRFGRAAEPAGAWNDLARLALPVGVGEATALADAGLEAIAISSSGERPPPPEGALVGAVSAGTMTAAGSTLLSTILTLDEAPGPPARGPAAFVRVGDNLLPGWTLALLALTLLLPSLIAAADLWLRDRRRSPRTTRRSIPWVLERALLPLAALLLAYALAAAGLIPAPPFPYDPARFGPEIEGPIALTATALAVVAVALLVRPLRTQLDTEPQTLAAASGLLCCLAVAAIWLVNPFLALLLAPSAHVWLLPARAQGPPPRTAIAAAVAVALLPALAAGIEVAASLDLGLAAPWHLLLMFTSGHFGPPTGLALCALGGGLISSVAAAGAGIRLGPPGPRQRVRGPAGHAGPGSLGGTPSSLPRA